MTRFDCIDGDFFEQLSDGHDIIYFPIDDAEQAFKARNRHKFLITHNGDRAVDQRLLDQFLECGMYDFWYAQNTAVRHDRLFPLPIGFERKRWCRFSKYDIIKEYSRSGIIPTKTLYGNFSVGTNSSKRMSCYNSFKGKQYFTDRVCQRLPHPSCLPEQMFKNYCREVMEHKFILCPEGNGIDTHRFWETLCLGRIPVVLHNPVNDYFSSLPVVVLDKWEDFDPDCYIDFDFEKTADIMPMLTNTYIKIFKAQL